MLDFQKKLSNGFYLVLGLPSTAMGFGLSIQIAVLSWILSTKYNLDIHHIGFVWAAGPIAGILGQPLIGLISDKVWFLGGRRRPFIIIGGILTALAVLALPNIGAINDFLGLGSLIAVAITVALTLDLAINISFNPTRAIIADVTPDGNPRTKGYTWMQSISNLFGSLAYLTGALLGNYTLIYAGAFVILGFSIIPMFFIEEPRHLVQKKDEVTAEATPTQWGQLFRIYGAHFFSWLGVQTMFVYIIAFLQQKMFSPDVVQKYAIVQELKQKGELLTEELLKIEKLVSDETGQMIGIAFFLLNAVSFLMPAFLLEPLSRKIGRVRVHVASLTIMALGYFTIAMFVHTPLMLYIMIAVICVGWAAIVSLPFAIMSEKVDKSRMGYFMGIFNLSVVLPQLVASLFLGTVIQSAGNKSIVFLISAVSLAISAFLWVFVSDKSSSQPQNLKK
jgi:MFS family permease